MSLFDPESFLDTTINTQFATNIPPIPEGEHLCLVTALDPKVITGKSSGEDFFILEVECTVDTEEAREATGMKEPKARKSLFMDIDDDGCLKDGETDNVDLGKFREALGQNNENEDWKPSDMLGQVFIGSIYHEPSNKENDDRVFSRIGATAAIG